MKIKIKIKITYKHSKTNKNSIYMKQLKFETLSSQSVLVHKKEEISNFSNPEEMKNSLTTYNCFLYFYFFASLLVLEVNRKKCFSFLLYISMYYGCWVGKSAHFQWKLSQVIQMLKAFMCYARAKTTGKYCIAMKIGAREYL